MENCWKHLENVWGRVGLKSIFFAFAADLKIRGATTWSGSDQCLVSAPCPLLSCLSPTLIRSLFRPRCCCCCLLTKYLLVEMRKRDLLNALNKLCYVSSYDKNNIFIARRYNTWNLEKKFRQFPTEDIGNWSNQVNHIKYDMSKFKQRRDGKSFRDEVSIDYKWVSQNNLCRYCPRPHIISVVSKNI